MEEILKEIRNEIAILQNSLDALNSVRIELENAKNLVRDHIERIAQYVANLESSVQALNQKYESFAAEVKDACISDLKKAGDELQKASELLVETQEALQEVLQRSIDTNEEVAKRGKEVFDFLDGLDLDKRLDRIDDHLKEIINERIGALAKQVEMKADELENSISTKFERVSTELAQVLASQVKLEKANRVQLIVTIGIGVIVTALLVLIKWG